MRRLLQEYLLFWKEVWRTYHTTGAILPSSRALGKALAWYVGQSPEEQWILEVGPGTGAVTRWILARMRPQDHLDLVELNERFVAQLHQRFASDSHFQVRAGQVRIFHIPIEQLAEDRQYDRIISGLPLNNFQPAEVQQIFEKMIRLLRPGGVLSFFEYIGIRRLKALVSGAQERERLRQIGGLFQELFQRAEIRRDRIWWNLPPAWVHHLRPDPEKGPSGGAARKGFPA